ncbi:MAG: hypothetical protein ACQESC_01215 [Nanobdellota archaeon]
MDVKKINQYFFIAASLIILFDGVLDLSPEMRKFKFIALIISGLLIGIFKDHSDNNFLFGGLAVVISGFVLFQLLGFELLSGGLGEMLLDIIIFVLSIILVIGLSRVFSDLTRPDIRGLKQEKKDLKKLHSELEKDISSYTFETVWGIVILVAVALAFISIFIQLFFDPFYLTNILKYVDAFITVIFIVDVVILAFHSKNTKDFFKRHFIDVIAAIPAVGVLRVFKLVRVFRIARILRSGAKLGQAMKLYKTFKFFSSESYFNKFNDSHPSSNKKKSSKKPSQKKSPRRSYTKKVTRSSRKN